MRPLPWWLVATLLLSCRTAPRDQAPTPIQPLEPLFHRPSTTLAAVLARPETYRVQLLVSEVIESKAGKPGLRRHGYRVDAEYFYPASSIKLCAAVAALQAIEALQVTHHTHGLVDAPIEIEPLFEGDPRQAHDPDGFTPPTDHPITLRRELRKLALVSDNQAYNRLFDLVGHEDLNRRMHALGLTSVVLNHRLSDPRPIPSPTATAAVTFRPLAHAPITVPARTSTLSLTNSGRGLKVGTGTLQGNTITEGPMDFIRRNGIRLVDLQDLLIKVVRPDLDLGAPALDLHPGHRSLLLEAMTQYPRESVDPRYPEADYPDHYSKFLLPGVRRVFPATTPGERIEITGKIGRAYGFSVENAYLRNPANGRAVFVTAVIYTNADGILNDDQYEYDQVADPFLEDLGERIARKWLTR